MQKPLDVFAGCPCKFATCMVAVLSVFATSCSQRPAEAPKKPPTPHEVLAKAAAFLVAKESKDGGWHSDTYGNLKGGVATTALVCYSLAHLPEDLRKEHEPAIRRGLEQLVSQINREKREGATVGFVGDRNGGANYPTYVTGMTLAAYHRMGWALADRDRKAMIDYLESAQLGHSRGWKVDDAEFGGWDLLGDLVIEGQTPGSNVSVASFAMEGFSTDRSEVDIPALLFAESWLDKLQQVSTNGGFACGPKQSANKAGFRKEGDKVVLHSYGSATCDGLRLLAYLGVDRDDDRVTKAIAWLAGNDTVTKVPGDGNWRSIDSTVVDSTVEEDPELEDTTGKQWPKSLYYYYTMTLAKTYGLYPTFGSVTRRGRLADQLIKRQNADGSWINAATGMREDDPLVATSFALVALAESTK